MNLGNEFEHFKNCDIAGKSHFILGTELWGSRYEELLRLVKSYIIDIWELHKSKLYGSGTGPLQYRSRPRSRVEPIMLILTLLFYSAIPVIPPYYSFSMPLLFPYFFFSNQLPHEIYTQ